MLLFIPLDPTEINDALGGCVLSGQGMPYDMIRNDDGGRSRVNRVSGDFNARVGAKMSSGNDPPHFYEIIYLVILTVFIEH